MAKLEVKKVRTYSLEYDSFPGDGKTYMTLTEWANGEGFDLDIEGKNDNQHIKLPNQDMAALLVLYGKCNLIDGSDDEEEVSY